mmetsp:Transcript_26828/g.53555  ORF Transcript_26828/g.53555 Transcript_26828/m.53555 type:complete len:232 (+) Transcript_26828:227-922(+)
MLAVHPLLPKDRAPGGDGGRPLPPSGVGDRKSAAPPARARRRDLRPRKDRPGGTAPRAGGRGTDGGSRTEPPGIFRGDSHGSGRGERTPGEQGMDADRNDPAEGGGRDFRRGRIPLVHASGNDGSRRNFGEGGIRRTVLSGARDRVPASPLDGPVGHGRCGGHRRRGRHPPSHRDGRRTGRRRAPLSPPALYGGRRYDRRHGAGATCWVCGYVVRALGSGNPDDAEASGTR